MKHPLGLILASLSLIAPQWSYALDVSFIPSAQPTGLEKSNWHDPTTPSNIQMIGKTHTEEKGPLQLRSTLIGKTRRIALINDTFVEVGDSIGTAKVVAIHAGSVVLIDSGRTLTLHLFDNSIRK